MNTIDGLTIQKLTIDDQSLVLNLLQQAGLPISDIDMTKQLFIKAVSHDEVVGIGALEIMGNYGLIRSVVVRDHYRGKGTGIILIKALIKEAKEAHLQQLFLLTETAEKFFSKLSFTNTNREQVPDLISKLPEFTSLCPSSATCMTYKIK